MFTPGDQDARQMKASWMGGSIREIKARVFKGRAKFDLEGEYAYLKFVNISKACRKVLNSLPKQSKRTQVVLRIPQALQ